MVDARRRSFRRPAVVILSIAALVAAVVLLGGHGLPPRSVSFSQSAKDVKVYDFVEITAQVSAPHAPNPFTDAVIRGTFERVVDGKRWQVEGFSDAEDGSVYRVRFMPPVPGQYTAIAYGQRCLAFGVRPSMGSVGDAYDNALCESFFATLECELLDRERFRTPAEARRALFDYIEGWYDPQRRHSALGYESPLCYERMHATTALLKPAPKKAAAVLPLGATIAQGGCYLGISPNRPYHRSHQPW